MRQVCLLLLGFSPRSARAGAGYRRSACADALPGAKPPRPAAPGSRAPPKRKVATRGFSQAGQATAPTAARHAAAGADNCRTEPRHRLRRRLRPCLLRRRRPWLLRRSSRPPSRRRRPPPPPPISDTATGAATAIGAGLRVTFGAGESDLSPASATAIQALVRTAPTATTPASTWWPMQPAPRKILPPRGGSRCRGRSRYAAR